MTFQFFFHLRGRRPVFMVNVVLFGQEISKEIILLCMDYDITLRFENVESQK